MNNQSAEIEQVTRDQLIEQVEQGNTGIVYLLPQVDISHMMIIIKATGENTCSMQIVEKDKIHPINKMDCSIIELVIDKFDLQPAYAFCYVLPKSEQIMNAIDMHDDKYMFDLLYTIMDAV